LNFFRLVTNGNVGTYFSSNNLAAHSLWVWSSCSAFFKLSKLWSRTL